MDASAWYAELKRLHSGLIVLREEYDQFLLDQEQARLTRSAALATARQELMTHMSNAPEDLE
jgi:hypothetical protein